MRPCVLLVSALLLLVPHGAAAQSKVVSPLNVEDFIRKQSFNVIKISPTGEYFAATVPIESKTVLVILRRSDNKMIASQSIPGDKTHVLNFWWVNDERVLLSAAEKFGALEQPQPTGELYAINVDGKKGEMLVGQRLQGDGLSHIQSKKAEAVAASLVDDLPADDKYVVISVSPFSDDPYTRVERMNVYTGQRTPITRAPIRNAWFLTDNAGNVRFSSGTDKDNSGRLYYREVDGKDWKLVNDTVQSRLDQSPLGFSPDDKIAYLQVEHEQGPDSVVAWDLASGEHKQVFRDNESDPAPLYLNGKLIGVEILDGIPRKEFFDPESSQAKLYRKLERSFPGESVHITSTTKDGNLALVLTTSDHNPGDFFLFDLAANHASFLLSRRDWIDPLRAAKVEPIRFAARDGQSIHGYLTSPVGGVARNSPLIVLIHGGPFSISDDWGFDNDAQILAAHGYSVLQVNFRGSGGRGKAFMAAGKRQWGGTMQDDITDATRWAIKEGIADPKKICLYGASYGGYASLMGVAKEPDLYRCAAGYVGVYDLPMMFTDGDIHKRASGEAYLNEWLGSRQDLASASPNRLADHIKVPVFLTAGGADKRAPIQHTKMMEKALLSAGVPVEAVYYPTEGHGFYKTENAREFYGKLLLFFQHNLGGRAPVIVADSDKK